MITRGTGTHFKDRRDPEGGGSHVRNCKSRRLWDCLVDPDIKGFTQVRVRRTEQVQELKFSLVIVNVLNLPLIIDIFT